MKNVKDVAEKIKLLQSQNNRNVTKYVNVSNDNYRKYLTEGKSRYEEMKSRMKKIRAVVKFKDMANHNMLRYVGDEFIVEDARANDLISRGFAKLVEEIKPKVEKVEVAIEKEEKKEKAVKEKAVKEKKNAKK